MTRNVGRVARSAAALVLVAVGAGACGTDSGGGGGGGGARHARQARDAAAPPLVRGSVESITPSELVVRTETGTVDVKLTSPLQVFERAPATLADVKDGVFIGVTTVKQPDGSERATEIHIFPEALRGLGEGSRMMGQSSGGSSRMTNGAVSGSRMTNGAVSGSRMTNGSVAAGSGSSLVVQYAGGSVQVVVPPDVKVTQLKATTKPLAPGDPIVVPATRAPDGSLSTDKALLAGR
ncbi:MAG TPA: hypothetical protein VF832_02340 [Longimicrobiales bacterium]